MNRWKRVGFHYESTYKYIDHDTAFCTVIRSLGFVTYHLIRWIHGDKKLKEMAEKRPE